jgi:heme oxygenase
MTLPDRMRAAIAASHTAVEATPFARAMVEGRVTRETYAVMLRALYQLHAALEGGLVAAARQCPEVCAVYRPETMDRAELIAGDLTALGFDADAEPEVAPDLLAAHIAEWARENPHALLGALYVVEGSRMGSMVLARTLGPALGVGRGPGSGLDYHTDGIATRPQDWQRFRGALAALPLTEAQQADALAAAEATMNGLVELYAALPVAEPVLSA